MTVLVVFLNGIARNCAHQAMCSGLCSPTKRANAWIAASRWLRVAIAHRRDCSKSAKKETYEIGRQIDHCKSVHGFSRLLCNKRNEQGQCIAVTSLSITCQFALGYQMFQQEASDPAAQQGGVTHLIPPEHTARTACLPPAAVPVSWLDNAGSPRYECARGKWLVGATGAARQPLGDTRLPDDER
jgi:hypothetical protein